MILILSGMRPIRFIALPLTLVILLLGATGCRQRDRAAERIAEDSASAQKIDNNLTFSNITLEQANDQGQTLWKVHASQATYKEDQKVAQVRNPDGELFQDGKPVFRVQAQRGEVQQNGEKILLKGRIVARDIKSGAILRGDELEWTPKEDTLIVRNHLTGTHPQIRAAAREARLFNRQRRMELFGQVVATTVKPDLRLHGEHLTWEMDQQRVTSDRPIRVERLKGNQVTDTAVGQQAEVDLKTKVATLKQNAQLDLLEPPLRVSSNALVWNLNNETLVSNVPLTVIHRQQQITLTADQGRMDLQRRIFYLTQNVHAVGRRDRAQLTSDRLTWKVPTQEVEAEGNVVYRQADPPVRVTGPRAIGKLENQTIVVSGGRVTTEIVPDRLIR